MRSLVGQVAWVTVAICVCIGCDSGNGSFATNTAKLGANSAGSSTRLLKISQIQENADHLWNSKLPSIGFGQFPNRVSRKVMTLAAVKKGAIGNYFDSEVRAPVLELEPYDLILKQANGDQNLADRCEWLVIQHLNGHQIQAILNQGNSSKGFLSGTMQASEIALRTELQADYLAGVAAKLSINLKFTKDDITRCFEVISAASEEYKKNENNVRKIADPMTHGTLAQRTQWAVRGFDRGTVKMAGPLFEKEL